MFGENESESPRTPSPWISRSCSVATTPPPSTSAASSQLLTPPATPPSIDDEVTDSLTRNETRTRSAPSSSLTTCVRSTHYHSNVKEIHPRCHLLELSQFEDLGFDDGSMPRATSLQVPKDQSLSDSSSAQCGRTGEGEQFGAVFVETFTIGIVKSSSTSEARPGATTAESESRLGTPIRPHVPPPPTTTILLPPEIDDRGHIEYKYKLSTPTSSHRLERLRTQLKWRLVQGGGTAVYELGVLDHGELVGLGEDEMSESLDTLQNMLRGLGGGQVRINRVIRLIREEESESSQARTGKEEKEEGGPGPGQDRIISPFEVNCTVTSEGEETGDVGNETHEHVRFRPSNFATTNDSSDSSRLPPTDDTSQLLETMTASTTDSTMNAVSRKGPTPYPSNRSRSEQSQLKRSKRDSRRTKREKESILARQGQHEQSYSLELPTQPHHAQELQQPNSSKLHDNYGRSNNVCDAEFGCLDGSDLEKRFRTDSLAPQSFVPRRERPPKPPRPPRRRKKHTLAAAAAAAATARGGEEEQARDLDVARRHVWERTKRLVAGNSHDAFESRTGVRTRVSNDPSSERGKIPEANGLSRRGTREGGGGSKPCLNLIAGETRWVVEAVVVKKPGGERVVTKRRPSSKERTVTDEFATTTPDENRDEGSRGESTTTGRDHEQDGRIRHTGGGDSGNASDRSPPLESQEAERGDDEHIVVHSGRGRNQVEEVEVEVEVEEEEGWNFLSFDLKDLSLSVKAAAAAAAVLEAEAEAEAKGTTTAH